MNAFVFTLVGLGLFFSLLRLLTGPTPFDRVLSLDTMNIIISGSIVLIALIFNNALYLDIAIVYAVLAFLETIVFARYLEGRS
ncbi:MAG: cation:proton antiporter [delta proteobacterium ML8_F1]|nr:MAG: cation:proton antiporter [delta proteobacterium ML8_F1]